jgi:protein TonB
MFSDSLLDSKPTPTRRGWSTLLSFIVEAILIALLVLVPLLSGVALPTLKSTIINLPLGSPTAPPRIAVSHPAHGMTVVTQASTVLRIPHAIPSGIRPERGEPNAPIAPPTFGFGSPAGRPDIPPIFTGNFVPPPPKPPTPAPAKPLVISHMDPGALVQQVEPAYPELAKIARIQGTVQLAAVIAHDGTISKLRVLSGPPLLVAAAVDAVRQWRYRPYILNGQPVEVETQVSVNFKLGQQ